MVLPGLLRQRMRKAARRNSFLNHDLSATITRHEGDYPTHRPAAKAMMLWLQRLSDDLITIQRNTIHEATPPFHHTLRPCAGETP